MIALALTKMPGSGFATSADAAYTSMVAQLLPHGIRGVVACGMLALLMASLASKFNTSATLFTMDFYQKWHPNASGRTQVVVGRMATVVIVLIGILWIPVTKTLGKNLYEYLQSIQATCRRRSRCFSPLAFSGNAPTRRARSSPSSWAPSAVSSVWASTC